MAFLVLTIPIVTEERVIFLIKIESLEGTLPLLLIYAIKIRDQRLVISVQPRELAAICTCVAALVLAVSKLILNKSASNLDLVLSRC